MNITQRIKRAATENQLHGLFQEVTYITGSDISLDVGCLPTGPAKRRSPMLFAVADGEFSQAQEKAIRNLFTGFGIAQGS